MAELRFYYSSMNAGKTANLLIQYNRYKEIGLNSMIFVPQDVKFNTTVDGKVTSRIGKEASAYAFSSDFSFVNHLRDINWLPVSRENNTLILIDEAQFMSRQQVTELTDLVDYYGVNVYAYGLRANGVRTASDPFEGSKYLLAWSDIISEIETKCFCGKKATRDLLINRNGELIEKGAMNEFTGSKNGYLPLCRFHSKELVKHNHINKIDLDENTILNAAFPKNKNNN